MNKPESPKPNIFSKLVTNLSWISALLFPKKSKPISKPGVAPMSRVPPSAPTQHAPAAPTPAVAPKPAAVVPPPVRVAAMPARPPANAKTKQPIFQPGKLLPAFWTVASGLSFIVNVILIVTLIILGQELFELKRLVGNHVIDGLYQNFVLMDNASIKTNIQVQDTIPVNFTLPISQDTVVTLTEPTRVNNVLINLNSGGLSINSPANIVLPAGTNLPVHLNLTVPVDTQIPILLNVPVNIPLNQTELHKPFAGLQKVIGPFNTMLDPNVTTASHLPMCQDAMLSWFCDSFFVK